MSEVTASFQVSAFTTPANETAIDADQVRGNDNTLRAGLNSHDGEPGVHLQGSVLAERPIAGTAGRKWMTTDDFRIFYDDGSNWREIAYVPTGSAAALTSLTVGGTLALAATSIVGSGAGGLVLTASTGAASLGSTAGSVSVSAGGGGAINFQTNGTNRWTIDSTGRLSAIADGSYDIGNVAGGRVRTIYQNGSTVVVNASGTKVLGVQQTGWTTDPTGTLTRTTFDSTTVTLANLAARVAALIVDLRTHGLVGP